MKKQAFFNVESCRQAIGNNHECILLCDTNFARLSIIRMENFHLKLNLTDFEGNLRLTQKAK